MSTTSLLVQSLPVLAQGAVLTVKFAVLSMVFGLLGAVVLAMMGIRQSEALDGFERIWVNALAWLARAYVSLMRGTPLLVQIFVIYYGLPSLGISLDPTPAGVIALSANVAAYMSESMRGAINGIARGQWLAAYSLPATARDGRHACLQPVRADVPVHSTADTTTVEIHEPAASLIRRRDRSFTFLQ